MSLQLGAFNGLPKIKEILLGLNHITSLQNGESTDSQRGLIRARYVSCWFEILTQATLMRPRSVLLFSSRPGQNLDLGCAWVSDSSTFCAGYQRSQPEQVSNPDSVHKEVQNQFCVCLIVLGVLCLIYVLQVSLTGVRRSNLLIYLTT